MATWNSGVKYNSGTLWGPASASPSLFHTRHRKPNSTTTMKRKPYFPIQIAARPGWFRNFGIELLKANETLLLPAPDVAARVADALESAYTCGAWLTWARECGQAATAAVETQFFGQSAGVYELPVFTPPPRPGADTTVTPPIPATVPVPAGALKRLQDYVGIIKRSPHYTEAIGYQLGIIGEESTSEEEIPEFTLKLERGAGCECVRVDFKKFGHEAVVVYSRRGTGDWEKLTVDMKSPYIDARPLLVPGQPEVREYRLQFQDDDVPNGPLTPVQSVTVAP